MKKLISTAIYLWIGLVLGNLLALSVAENYTMNFAVEVCFFQFIAIALFITIIKLQNDTIIIK